MSTCKSISIPIASSPIIISKISPTQKKERFFDKEYSLKENNFDPSKSSPPNNFMSKLQQRIEVYNSFIKEDSFSNE